MKGYNILATTTANLQENEELDPYVEQHLRELLGPAGLTSNLFGARGEKGSKIGQKFDPKLGLKGGENGEKGGEGAEGNKSEKFEKFDRTKIPFRPSSAPSLNIPRAVNLNATQDRFNGLEEGKDSAQSLFSVIGAISEMGQNGENGQNGQKYGQNGENRHGQNGNRSGPNSGPPTARTYSISSVRDPAFQLLQNANALRCSSPISTSPQQHNSTWGLEKKQSFLDRKNGNKAHTLSSNCFSVGDFAVSEEMVTMRAEINELKAQRKIDQVTLLMLFVRAYFLLYLHQSNLRKN